MKKEKNYRVTLNFKTSISKKEIQFRLGITPSDCIEEEVVMPEKIMEYNFSNLKEIKRKVVSKEILGVLKTKLCKITGEKTMMVYVGDNDAENGNNGHPGWICLHKGE